MKRLTLFRHGKSGWDSPVSRDFDRPISERGVRGSTLMGEQARARGIIWDHIVSSPAVRCTETLDALWEGYGEILHPNWDRRVYLASGDSLLDVVQDLPDAESDALICGHNPGMEELALMLAPDVKGDALRDEIEEKFPTASMAVLELSVAHWADAKAGTAKITHFIRPRDLEAALGPDMD